MPGNRYQFDQDQGADQQASTRRKGQDQQDSPPPTFLEVYSLGQPHTLEDLTQRDALVRRGTKALLAAVRDRLDEGQCGEVRHTARLCVRLHGGCCCWGWGKRRAGHDRQGSGAGNLCTMIQGCRPAAAEQLKRCSQCYAHREACESANPRKHPSRRPSWMILHTHHTAVFPRRISCADNSSCCCPSRVHCP